MNESKTSGLRRPTIAFVLAAVMTAAAIWASVAMASSGSPSSGAGPKPDTYAVYGGPSMYAASGKPQSSGQCPNMGGSGGGGSSTAPSATPSAPSTQSGSASASL